MVSSIISSIHLIEEGQDGEHWAGHFGSEFSNQLFYLNLSSSVPTVQNPKNLLSYFTHNPVHITANLSSTFNLGFGTSYYINGILHSDGPWMNHSEYDASLLLDSVTRSESTSQQGFTWHKSITDQGSHYSGGSSLEIAGQLEGGDQVVIPMQRMLFCEREYGVRVVYKMIDGAAGMSLVIDGEQDIPLITKKEVNGWCSAEIEGLNVERFQLKEVQVALKIKNLTSTKSTILLRVGLTSFTSLSKQSDKIQLIGNPIITRSIDQMIKLSKQPLFYIGFEWDFKCMDIKHFKIYRDGNLIGITSTMLFLDRSTAKPTSYTIQAVSHSQDIMDSLYFTL